MEESMGSAEHIHDDDVADIADEFGVVKGLWDCPIVYAGTPIGNLGDVTVRLVQLLRTASIIACEDTRVTRRLIQALGITTQAQLLSLHAHNEHSRAAELITAASEGHRVLVVSDAGMPAVSDPGAQLLRRAQEQNVKVTVAPGASAVTTALVLSGIVATSFRFAGFYPRNSWDQHDLIRTLSAETSTTIIFESPHRVASTLQQLAEFFPDREAALGRELTKKYEELLRLPLKDLAGTLTARVHQRALKGECVLVISAADPTEPGLAEGFSGASTAQEMAETAVAASNGMRLKDAVRTQVHGTKFSVREVYALAVQIHHDR